MKSVFEVKYESVVDGKHDLASSASKNVLARDAEDAVAKVKKDVLGETWNYDDDKTGKKKTAKITHVRVTGVLHVCDIDL